MSPDRRRLRPGNLSGVAPSLTRINLNVFTLAIEAFEFLPPFAISSTAPAPPLQHATEPLMSQPGKARPTTTIDRVRLHQLLSREESNFIAAHPKCAALYERA